MKPSAPPAQPRLDARRTRGRHRRGSVLLPAAVGSGLAALAIVVGARGGVLGLDRDVAAATKTAELVEVRLEWSAAGRPLSEPAVVLSGRGWDAILRSDTPVRLDRDAWRGSEPTSLVPGWRLRPVLPVTANAQAQQRFAIRAVPLHHVLVRARDAETGEALPAFRVAIEWRAGADGAIGAAPAASVDAVDGEVLFEGVPLADGGVRVAIDAPEHASTRTGWRALDAGGWLEVDVALARL